MPDKPFVVAAALLVFALAGLAQDDKTHAAPSSHASGTATPSRSGNWANGPRGVGTPSAPAVNNRAHNPRNTYRTGRDGYTYGWGTPVELPYDSEYDQLEGRGTFDQGQQPEAPDNRVGPTIFEHNGQVSGAVADSRYAGPRNLDRGETASAPKHESSTEAAVLVFRDGHQQEVENYAIAGNKLIVLGEKTERIQLSDLDLNATAKANEDRGVDFKMPHQG
jgi:hypothetical protein